MTDRAKPLFHDTSPEAEEVQISFLRRADVSRRLQLVQALVEAAHRLSWEGLQKRYSDLPLPDLQVQWVRLLYGEAIASQIAERLRSTDSPDGRA